MKVEGEIAVIPTTRERKGLMILELVMLVLLMKWTSTITIKLQLKGRERKKELRKASMTK